MSESDLIAEYLELDPSWHLSPFTGNYLYNDDETEIYVVSKLNFDNKYYSYRIDRKTKKTIVGSREEIKIPFDIPFYDSSKLKKS